LFLTHNCIQDIYLNPQKLFDNVLKLVMNWEKMLIRKFILLKLRSLNLITIKTGTMDSFIDFLNNPIAGFKGYLGSYHCFPMNLNDYNDWMSSNEFLFKY
jgi:hypothetical protein